MVVKTWEWCGDVVMWKLCMMVSDAWVVCGVVMCNDVRIPCSGILQDGPNTTE